MSTLEKAMELLQELPEHKLEAVYLYMRFVDEQMESEIPTAHRKKGAKSIMGIARQYADPERIAMEEGAFANAMEEKHASD